MGQFCFLTFPGIENLHLSKKPICAKHLKLFFISLLQWWGKSILLFLVHNIDSLMQLQHVQEELQIFSQKPLYFDVRNSFFNGYIPQGTIEVCNKYRSYSILIIYANP